MFKRKDSQFEIQLPNEDLNLTASQGWLNRWKKRHDVRQLIIEECLSGDKNASDDCKNKYII